MSLIYKNVQESKLRCDNNVHILSEDCVLGEYGDWSICSQECGGGIQSRTREVVQDAENNGAACGEQVLTESRECNIHDCSG